MLVLFDESVVLQNDFSRCCYSFISTFPPAGDWQSEHGFFSAFSDILLENFGKADMQGTCNCA